MDDTLQRQRVCARLSSCFHNGKSYGLSRDTKRGLLFVLLRIGRERQAERKLAPVKFRIKNKGAKRNNKMSENKSTEVVIRKPKTAAPMVLGVIAFVLSLPSTLCASICSGVISAATNGEVDTSFGPAIMFGGPLVNMIASFFCKNKSSKGIGILIILISLLFMVISVLCGVLMNIASAIMFFIAGSFCIANASRPD